MTVVPGLHVGLKQIEVGQYLWGIGKGGIESDDLSIPIPDEWVGIGQEHSCDEDSYTELAHELGCEWGHRANMGILVDLARVRVLKAIGSESEIHRQTDCQIARQNSSRFFSRQIGVSLSGSLTACATCVGYG